MQGTNDTVIAISSVRTNALSDLELFAISLNDGGNRKSPTTVVHTYFLRIDKVTSNTVFAFSIIIISIALWSKTTICCLSTKFHNFVQNY